MTNLFKQILANYQALSELYKYNFYKSFDKLFSSFTDKFI